LLNKGKCSFAHRAIPHKFFAEIKNLLISLSTVWNRSLAELGFWSSIREVKGFGWWWRAYRNLSEDLDGKV
jgi:hypothetical protein